MSIRIEQYRSLMMTRELLFDLLYPVKTPRVPSAVRKRARDCVRHFPFLDGRGVPVFSNDSIGLDDMASPVGNPAGVTFGAQNVSNAAESGNDTAADCRIDHIGDVTELVPYVGPDVCPACRGRRVSEPMADFIGDDPKTMRVCTMSYCQLCGGTGKDPNWRRVPAEPFGDAEEFIAPCGICG